jgi:hypothetical protein
VTATAPTAMPATALPAIEFEWPCSAFPGVDVECDVDEIEVEECEIEDCEVDLAALEVLVAVW